MNIVEMLINGNYEFQYKLIKDLEKIEIPGKVPKFPVLILTCMDPRIDIHRIFQLKPGDVFILRNAGNVYSKDILRSILIAICEFNIQYIIVLGHLDCGMTKINLEELKEKLSPNFVKYFINSGKNHHLEIGKFFKVFRDEFRNVENQVELLKNFPDFPLHTEITGMMYDVNTGWVFEPDEIEMSNKEEFFKNYEDLLRKKHNSLTNLFKKSKIEDYEQNQQINISFINNLGEIKSKSLVHQDQQYNNDIQKKIIQLRMLSVNIPKIKTFQTINFRKKYDIMNLNIHKEKRFVLKSNLPKISINIPRLKVKSKFQEEKTVNRAKEYSNRSETQKSDKSEYYNSIPQLIIFPTIETDTYITSNDLDLKETYEKYELFDNDYDVFESQNNKDTKLRYCHICGSERGKFQYCYYCGNKYGRNPSKGNEEP